MDKKAVIVSFIGTQDDGHENDKIELVTEGAYYKKGESYYITYDESSLTGMDGTTTTVKVEDNKRITLMRYGKNNTQLVFEKGQNHVCAYETEHGSFFVGVRSRNVLVNLDDFGGEISAKYQLEINNGVVGQNDFYMNIKEQQTERIG